MFQGAVRLMVGRVLLAAAALGCLLLSASAASACANAEARAGVAQVSDSIGVGGGRLAQAALNLRSCEAVVERSLDDAERRSAMPVSPVAAGAPQNVMLKGAPAGSDASRFGHFGARPGRGAKGARAPGEVQGIELPAG